MVLFEPAASLRVFCLERPDELACEGSAKQKTKTATGRLKVQLGIFGPPPLGIAGVAP